MKAARADRRKRSSFLLWQVLQVECLPDWGSSTARYQRGVKQMLLKAVVEIGTAIIVGLLLLHVIYTIIQIWATNLSMRKRKS